MDEDKRLIQRFKNRDISAFDELFSKYYKPIYYYVYKMLYNPQIAEDMTQDTLIKVYKNLNSIDSEIKLSSWIYKIAHNACIDYIRKSKINFELIDNINYLDKEENQPEDEFLNKEVYNKIKKVMMKINSKYRAVLILRDYNDLSYKEISNILGSSESAVKSLIYRARQEFQKIYKVVD